MKFLADEGIDKSLVNLLRNAGFDTVYQAESEQGADDVIVLEKANSEQRILITRDMDFGELAWRMKMIHTGIILVRAEELSSLSRSKLVIEFIASNLELLHNHFIVLQPGAARIRKMYA